MPSSRLSYANVVSSLALVVAVAGGGVAAAAVAKNSVGSAQIRNGAVKGPDVKPNSLSAKHIKDATLTNALIVAGPASGPGTLTSALTSVASVTITAPSNGHLLLIAECEFSATDTGTLVDVRINEGAAERFVGDWDPGDDDGLFDQTQTSTTVLPLTAGTHTYTLRLDESTPGTFADYSGARLTAVFTAQGRVSPARTAP